MRRMIPAWIALILALSFATIARAQDGTYRGRGAGCEREAVSRRQCGDQESRHTGQTYTTKTDKNGRFTQLGLLSGIYVVTLTNEKDHLNFAVKFRVAPDQENVFKLDLSEHKSELGPSAEEAKNGTKKRTSSRT